MALVRLYKRGGGSSEPTLQNILVSENGTYTAGPGYDGLGNVTVNVSGNNRVDDEADVVFLGPDGMPAYGFSKIDFMKLSEMPALPEYENLIPEKWNWSLEGAKAYVSEHGQMVIGSLYDTEDHGIEFELHLSNIFSDFLLYSFVCVNGTATVDWGDGSTSTITGTNAFGNVKYATHRFASGGIYRVKIYGAELGLFGSSTYGTYLISTTSATTMSATAGFTQNQIRAIHIGSDVIGLGSAGCLYNIKGCKVLTFSKDSFSGNNTNPLYINNGHLTGISLPNANISANHIINNNSDLRFISYPENYVAPPTGQFNINGNKSLSRVTIDSNIATNAINIQNAELIERLILPKNIDFIVSNGFSGCVNIRYVKALRPIVEIGNNAFVQCGNLEVLDLSVCDAVPVLGTGVFQTTIPNKRILVKASLYDEWIKATNWASVAHYIVAV